MIKVAKQDWDKFIRDNNPEVFTETHINQWIESNKELLQKSEANELTEEEGVLAENFKTELNHFTRIAVMGPHPDPLQKSLNIETFYIREQQVDWDKAEDGEIEKSRGGVYKDTSMNRKLGRVGQRFGGKKAAGDEDDDKGKRNLWIADRVEQLAKKHPDKSNDQLLRMAGKEWESKGSEKPESKEESKGKSGSELSEGVKKRIIDSQSDPSSRNAMRSYLQKEGYKFSSENGRLKVTNSGGSVSHLGGANSGDVLKKE